MAEVGYFVTTMYYYLPCEVYRRECLYKIWAIRYVGVTVLHCRKKSKSYQNTKAKKKKKKATKQHDDRNKGNKK